MLISEDNKRQFLEEGYFLLPEAIEQTMLDSICDVCDYSIEEFNTSERVNESDDVSSHEGELYTRVTGDGKQFETSVLNIKNSRYFLEQRHQEHPDLAKFIFSELMAEICKATIGQNAYFHFEEFVVKFPRGGASFSWHQDGAYVPKHGLPYVSAWCSLDAVSPENGTIYVLPYSRAGTRDLVDHSRDENEMERTGYHGEDPGVAVVLPAGSVAVFASNVLHRSGDNISNAKRRALLVQFSAEPILSEDGTTPWHSADPFLRDGEIIS
tara:strand:+ start:664 stop:1467 length:804 start_codon:yes stop_codon:yes gene_type:complete